jgi:hypothetical protein
MGNDLVTVASFADPVEANLAKNRLEASGIPAFLANEETLDMVWYWGNAMGWIKLQVGDKDASNARAILDQHDELETPADSEVELQVGPEAGPEEGSLEPFEDEAGDDPDRPSTARDQDAERAARGALLGILFLPLELYAFYLLLKVVLSRESLGDRERRNAIFAAVINLPIIFGFCLYAQMLLSSA